MARELRDLAPAELKAFSREKTLFIFSVSPLTDLGDHLSLGVKIDFAVALARRVTQDLETRGFECIYMPPLSLGVSSGNTQLSVLVRSHVLRDALVDQCESLHRLGFRWFLCFSAERSPRQLVTIEEAGQFLANRTSGWKTWTGRWVNYLPGVHSSHAVLMSADSALVDRSELWRAPMWPDPNELGGEQDTSRALAVTPSSVRPFYKTQMLISPLASRWARFSAWRKKEAQGHRGDPSQADATRGENALKAESDIIVAKVLAVLDGSPSSVVFRSGFSLFPTNSSVFWVWVMSFALFVLLLTWLVWAIQWMTHG
jgi:creatinine amidohydrolase/Fe(II)-dependent formamide hydrolase-like protein